MKNIKHEIQQIITPIETYEQLCAIGTKDRNKLKIIIRDLKRNIPNLVTNVIGLDIIDDPQFILDNMTELESQMYTMLKTHSTLLNLEQKDVILMLRKAATQINYKSKLTDKNAAF